MPPRLRNLFGCLLLPLLTLGLGLAISKWLGSSFLLLPLLGFGVWSFHRRHKDTDGGNTR